MLSYTSLFIYYNLVFVICYQLICYKLFVSNIIQFIVIWLSLSMGGSIFIDKRQVFNKVNLV